MRADTEASHAILKIVGSWRKLEYYEYKNNALPLPKHCRLQDVTRHQIL